MMKVCSFLRFTVLKQNTKLDTTSTFFISHLPNLKVKKNEGKNIDSGRENKNNT